MNMVLYIYYPENLIINEEEILLDMITFFVFIHIPAMF